MAALGVWVDKGSTLNHRNAIDDIAMGALGPLCLSTPSHHEVMIALGLDLVVQHVARPKPEGPKGMQHSNALAC